MQRKKSILKLIRIGAAYALSYASTSALVGLEFAAAQGTFLTAATSHASSAGRMETDAAAWAVTLVTPAIAGLLTGIIFTLLARPRILFHAGMYCIGTSVCSMIDLMRSPGTPVASGILLQAFYAAVIMSCAGAGRAVTAALSESDKPVESIER